MCGFYISEITAYEIGEKESTIHFSDGLNIILGPSNTGKTLILKYIDFMFGAQKFPESNFEVIKVTMTIKSRNKGSAILARETTQKAVCVNNSSIDGLTNGVYNLKGKNSINDIFLPLIGIQSPIKIFSKQDYSKTCLLTWRQIKNFFFTNEKEVLSEEPYFLSSDFKNITAILGCLSYLSTGQEKEKPKDYEDPNTKKIKKTTLIEYIQSKMIELENREKEISDNLGTLNSSELEALIQKDSQYLSDTTNEMRKLLDANASLKKQYEQTSNELREQELLLERLNELKSQYSSDIDRLEFIVNGEKNKMTFPQNLICPYCESTLNPRQHKTYILTEKLEIEKTEQSLKELQEVIMFNIKQKEKLQLQLDNVISKLNSNNSDIISIQYKLTNITNSISSYENIIKLKFEKNLLNSQFEKLKTEIQQIESFSKNTQTYFNIKSDFNDSFFSEIERSLDELIQKTDYENYKDIKIDRSSFDLMVNGKAKKNQGKGYRAFLNSAYAHSIIKYLSQHGKYNIGLLIIDSPILSLKEAAKKEDSSDSMKKELLKLFMDNSFKKQVIIVENELPNLDYSRANLIEFTKKETGRYGFIN